MKNIPIEHPKNERKIRETLNLLFESKYIRKMESLQMISEVIITNSPRFEVVDPRHNPNMAALNSKEFNIGRSMKVIERRQVKMYVILRPKRSAKTSKTKRTIVFKANTILFDNEIFEVLLHSNFISCIHEPWNWYSNFTTSSLLVVLVIFKRSHASFIVHFVHSD